MMTSEAAEREAAGVCEGSAGVTRSYVRPVRDQLFLLPVSMREWLDEGHLVWFVLDVVARLNMSGLHSSAWGRAGSSAIRAGDDGRVVALRVLLRDPLKPADRGAVPDRCGVPGDLWRTGA